MTEWDAEKYDKVNSLQKLLADRHLAAVELAGTEDVLDIGCGDGKVSAAVAQRLSRGTLLGIDPSAHMIAFAKSHHGGDEHPNLSFAPGDAAALDFDERFDLAISFNALHWVQDQPAVLAGVRRALRPGGGALLEFVPRGPRTSVEDVLEETARSARWRSYFEGHRTPYFHFTPEQYRRLAEAADLQVESIEVEDNNWTFGSYQALADWTTATFVAWTGKLREAERRGFVDDVLARYAAVADTGGTDSGPFKFYQMIVKLRRA